MTLTKADLKKALQKQQTNIVVEISKFLEKHVLEPLFAIKKDVSDLKIDVGRIERKLDASFDRANRHSKKLEDHEKRITRIEKTTPLTS